MSRLTVFLARFIGLFTILVVAGLLVRGSAIVEAAIADKPLLFTYAVISIALGLAMIIGHNIWSGGALPIVITLVGWLILAKGVLLFLIAPDALARLWAQMQYGEHYDLYLMPSLLVGIYLTWAGFTANLDRGP